MRATTDDELLAERRVHGAELALAAAQRRVAEAGAEIESLRRQVAELERASAAAGQSQVSEVARLQAALEGEARVRRSVERALAAERLRGEELLAELLARSGPSPRDELAAQELAAARARVEVLAAELEQVRRRAAEFEQSVRVAVREAWAWLDAAGERVRVALARADAVEARGWADPDTPAARGASRIVARNLPAAAVEASPDEPAPMPAAEGSERFDDALRRLRTQVEPAPDPGS